MAKLNCLLKKWYFQSNYCYSGKHIDCICSLCQININAWSLLMADPVKKLVELIPVFRDSFPRRLCRVEFQMTFFLVVIAPLKKRSIFAPLLKTIQVFYKRF